MTFAPIRSKSRSLAPWFATRSDLFTKERSPRKTVTWSVIGALMLVATLLIVLNADAVTEAMGGHRRAGLALVGAFGFPPLIAVLSLVMIFAGAGRWRVKGGGVLKNPVIHAYGAGFPIERVLDAVRQGDSPAIISGLAALQKDPGKDRLLTLWSSNEDRMTYAGVLRVEGDVIWIDQEPFLVGPDHYVDAQKHDLAATLGRDSVDGV